MKKISIQTLSYLDQSFEQFLTDGLNNNAEWKKKFSGTKAFSVVLQQNNKWLGGASCFFIYGSFHIDLLFLSPSIRGKGWGKKTMLAVEQLAKKEKALFATVNTMDFQALHFYTSIGYYVEFVREGFCKNAKMYLLRKNL